MGAKARRRRGAGVRIRRVAGKTEGVSLGEKHHAQFEHSQVTLESFAYSCQCTLLVVVHSQQQPRPLPRRHCALAALLGYDIVVWPRAQQDIAIHSIRRCSFSTTVLPVLPRHSSDFHYRIGYHTHIPHSSPSYDATGALPFTPDTSYTTLKSREHTLPTSIHFPDTTASFITPQP